MSDVGRIKIISGLSSRERWSRISFLSVVMIVLITGTICIFTNIKMIGKSFPGFLY